MAVLVVAWLTAACGALSTSPKTLMPAPSGAAFAEGTARDLADLLEEWVAEGNGTGVTAAVVSSGGSWSGASGVDGAGKPLSPESAMAGASITKTFTAAEVLHLADEGRLDLDAAVSDYVDLPFHAGGATVRQLLNMRGGFPVDPWEKFERQAANDVSRPWTDEDVLALVDEEAGRAGRRGGSQVYSNLSYVVLGMVVEEVTGASLAEAVRRDLIEPAGLERVWVQDEEVPTEPSSVGEEKAPGPRLVDPLRPYLPSRAVASAAGGAGAVAADAPSLARWGYLLYGGHVLGTELVELMTEGGDGDWYGLGTNLIRIDGEVVVGHRGSLAGYHGVLYVWPGSQVSVAVLVPNTANTHLGTGVDVSELAAEVARVAQG